MKNKTIAILSLTIFFLTNVDAQTTITIQPDSTQGKDALLHGLSSEVSTNYGSNPQLAASAWTFSGTPGVVRSALEFDFSMIPSGATINSAYLSLYAWDSENGLGQHSTLSGSNECWLQRITSAWDESTVNWNTQPAATTTNQVSISASTAPTQDYLNIDVSTLVQDMIDNPSASFGFLLRLQNESYYRLMNFASSDHINSALHPLIEICYSPKTTSIVENAPNNLEFNFYPNPAKNILNVVIANSESKNVSIEIFNSQGQLIKNLFNVKSLTSINISNMVTGIYYLKVGNSQNISTKKLLIK